VGEYMYCKSCKTELPKGLSYCPSCGISGDFLIETLEEDLSPKKNKKHLLITIIIGALVVVLSGIVLLSVFVKFKQPIPIGFFSQASGAYFVKNGSNVKVDDMSDISQSDLEMGNQFYLKDHDLYQLDYYKNDRLIDSNIRSIIRPEGFTTSVLYRGDTSYYLYNGEKIIDLDIDINILENFKYLKQGEIIAMTTFEGDIYHLYLYLEGEFQHIDSSEKPIEYIEWYNETCYYIKNNGDMTSYCSYQPEEKITVLTEIIGEGTISCVSSKGLSLIGSTGSGTWTLFQDNQVIKTYEGYDDMRIRYAASELTIIEIVDREDSKMLVMYENGQIEEIKNLANIPMNFTGYISDDGLRSIVLESKELVKYTYYDDIAQENKNTYYDIANYKNIRFDKTIEHLYFTDETNTLLSMDLKNGEVEIIQKGVVSYFIMNNGIIYGTKDDRSVYYKEYGVQPVKIVDTLEPPSLAFIAYVISYDGEHAYIQDGSSIINTGDVYFFDSEKYYTKLIDTDTTMYDMNYDTMNKDYLIVTYGTF